MTEIACYTRLRLSSITSLSSIPLHAVHRFRLGAKSGRLAPNAVVGMLQIQWTTCSGFTGRLRLDYATSRRSFGPRSACPAVGRLTPVRESESSQSSYPASFSGDLSDGDRHSSVSDRDQYKRGPESGVCNRSASLPWRRTRRAGRIFRYPSTPSFKASLFCLYMFTCHCWNHPPV